jgi:heme exporter protein C
MDKLLKFVIFVWLALVIVGAFIWAPVDPILKEMTRVLYFHVPTAWITVLAFLIGAVFSVLYLKKKDLVYDYSAEAASQIGFIFCLLATITGSIWAKMSWGSFWNWDPRETSIFILLLIYAAYFALRSAIEIPERRASLAAVYSIFAFITVPFFVFIIPRIYTGLHPDPIINEEAKMHLGDTQKIVFFSSLIGFTSFFIWMLVTKLQLVKLKMKIQNLES